MRDMKGGAKTSRKSGPPGQARLVLFCAALAALFAGVGIFHTSVRIDVVQAGYELGKVQREYQELLREHEHLKMERATLRSAPRLEAFARARLGMAPPSASQLVPLNGRAQARPAERTVAAVGPSKTLNP